MYKDLWPDLVLEKEDIEFKIKLTFDIEEAIKAMQKIRAAAFKCSYEIEKSVYAWGKTTNNERKL